MIGTLNKVVAPPASAAEDNPLWLIVLCDLMTNLMLFFLVLYSFSLRSEEEQAQAMLEMQRTMRGEVIVRPKKIEVFAALLEQRAAALAILKEFEKAGLRELTEVDVGESRIRIRLAAPVLFRSGQATLRPASRRRLRALAGLLRSVPSPILVEGHTDDLPLRAGPYRSNWELSAARAASVIAQLSSDFRIPESRFVAAGYGEFRPVADNATAAGRARNRRIEILLARTSSGAVLGRSRGGPDTGRQQFKRALESP